VLHGGVEVPAVAFRRSARRGAANETVWRADLGSVPGGAALAASSAAFHTGWVCANANGSRAEFFFGGAAFLLCFRPYFTVENCY
jgi:hypothetical protein